MIQREEQSAGDLSHSHHGRLPRLKGSVADAAFRPACLAVDHHDSYPSLRPGNVGEHPEVPVLKDLASRCLARLVYW